MDAPDRRLAAEMQAALASCLEEAEEAWPDDMGGRVSAPYRSDREVLSDFLLLADLRQQLYTRKVRAREWEDEVLGDRDPDAERARAHDLAQLQRRIDRLVERIELKRSLARDQGHALGIDAFARRYCLEPVELDLLLILLLEDITVTGQRTYSRGRDMLGVLFEDRLDVLEARRYLYPTGSLSRNGLIVAAGGPEATVLDAYFKISEKAIQELTAMDPRVASTRGLALESRQMGATRAVREPAYALSDVILPSPLLAQIKHIVSFVANRDLILGEWGFGALHGVSGHSTVLFSGPPGTGKTMTAQAVAHELGRRVLLVSYPELVSKWVGDTEKNLVAVFEEARASDAVLVFDEADAMFHSRVDISTATDQSFNREVNVLLQEVERFEGVLILTTNRAQGLDPAFDRRIATRLDFPIPDRACRRAIWDRHLSRSAPIAPDVDTDALARDYGFAGGHIRNATLRAAVTAAAREGADRVIRQADLVAAAELERTCPTRGGGARIGLRV